ncbi:hypothetical protein [Massilia sp. CCM 8734]|uniref:hypothetical protein n=1 Tax=Massilia sp. CCM 8734 TaxID=2609283 RepID=UPI001AAF0B82|nr:hypothetical protein [Massilia sp. CCM 8734]
MHSTSLLFAVLLGGALLPGAQAAAAAPPDPLRFTGPLLPMHGKVVKNAPYSAEAVSEQLQRLADGNEINRASSSMNYRDSAGRTRQEIRDADGELRTVTLYLPADGVTYILNPRQKSADKLPDPSAAATEAQAKAQAQAKVAQLRADAGDAVIVKSVERTEGDARKRVPEKARILVNNMAATRIGAAVESAFGDMRWAAQASTRELGSKEIEGVKANGKLRTYEIPAGGIGNRNAIVVSHESWYAPELKVTVYSKHSDPRSGERIYRLSNIKREEPPASLFVVPPDYTVRDVPVREVPVRDMPVRDVLAERARAAGGR